MSVLIKESGDLTAAIVETMRNPLVVLSSTLHVKTANQAFLDGFQVNRSETIGRLIYDLGDGQWNIPELRRRLEDILSNNSAFDDFEVTHDFLRIGPKTMLLNARQLQGGDGKSRLIVLMISDISERTRASVALKVTSTEQLRSNAELEQFAAVAAHDLQEPLRMVSSFAGLLQSRHGEALNDSGKKYVAAILAGAHRMAEMIRAILVYSQIGLEAAGITTIDSSLALRNALDNLKVKIDDAHADIIAEPLPHVVANREQLSQLFQNLVANAVKYRSSDRSPIIRVGAKEIVHEWIFSVADNGIGMYEADYYRIFLPYQRANTEAQIRGCGIGLSTCKKIVEHHKGRIWVTSEINRGSTFFFAIPK